MTTRILLICLLFVACSWHASAASGDVCNRTSDGSHYSAIADTDECKLLCDGLTETGGETTCGPITFKSQRGATTFICSIERAQAACEPGTISIQESNSAVAGAPNVWSEICSLTGVASPLVSSCSPERAPKGAIRASFSDITDIQCTDVDVTCTLKKTTAER